MTFRDLRTDLERLVAAHRYGRCEFCEWVLRLDELTREIFCPAEDDQHPGQTSRRPLEVQLSAFDGGRSTWAGAEPVAPLTAVAPMTAAMGVDPAGLDAIGLEE